MSAFRGKADITVSEQAQEPTHSSALRKLSALFCKPFCSSGESSGGKADMTPVRPTMLGNESVTP
jgi:hypothetical protein